jgi:hypothetical protein
MELKTFNRNVRTIKASGVKLDALVTATALGGLLLCEADGNATRMDQLLAVLPKGYRSEGFKLWVMAFSPIRWNGDGKIGVQKADAKNFTAYNHEGAAAVKFWDFSKENQAVKTLSLETLLAILAREAKYLDEADADGKVFKDGKQIKQIEGNVVNLKNTIQAMRAAANQPIAAAA